MTEKFGRYVIKSELGRGGMATVYYAYDPNFERDVAIKVLPGAFLHDPQLRARFEREAKMIASLEHPAIVPVYDFGDQDGQPYIVMRYMSGGSLADRLRDSYLSLEETYSIISRLAPALDAAHARGIIHRDIKPGNVLFDQYDNAFLSDFGIARQSQAVSTTLTGDSIVGTPAYMSPEQVQGEKNIDGRSDIYAMGVLVYQMLTGQAPYQADTPAKVMLMHILEPVPDIGMRKSGLPEGCQDVITHAMAKEPTSRFATTNALAEALGSLIRTKGHARPLPAVEQDQTLLSGATVVAHPKTHPPDALISSQASAGSTSVVARQPQATAIPTAPPAPQVRRFSWITLALLSLVFVAAIAVVAGIALAGRQPATAVLPPASQTPQPAFTQPSSNGSPTPLQDSTKSVAVLPIPSATQRPPSATPTNTEIPTSTPTPLPTLPNIGGADKIAFFNLSDIWVANLDGTDLRQLTTDGAIKISLQWTPDGDALTYISGACIYRVMLDTATVETITCFKYIDTLKSFDVSPDGSLASVIVDNQMYIVPFDLAVLKQVELRSDLTEIAPCKDFAPYLKNFITQVHWSQDSTVLAAKLIANLGGGIQGDLVQLFHVDQCIPNPKALDNFPAPRFEMKGYQKKPVIPSYSWDGLYMFALHTSLRNEGFGDLYVYNMERKKVYPEINPIGGSCCYRDPQWSPDGTHLLFAFQNIAQGALSTTQFYLIPYANVGTGATFTPLPLPEITDSHAKPMPVLRRAK